MSCPNNGILSAYLRRFKSARNLSPASYMQSSSSTLCISTLCSPERFLLNIRLRANACMSSSDTNTSRIKESQGTSVPCEGKQKTIFELFGTSKTTSAARSNPPDLQDSSPRKRTKHTHRTSPLGYSVRATAAMNSSPPAFMHGTRATNVPEVIDLTGSPSPAPSKSSPSRKRLSGSIRPTFFGPTGGPKKLVVKNLRTTPRTDPDQYYNHVWNQLDKALSAIFTDDKLPCSLEELYKGVESLCKQDRAPAVYKKLREKCKHTVSVQVLEPLIQHTSASTATYVLESVQKAWLRWRAQLVSPEQRI